MASGSYFIETWGCQMNELDSQRLAGQLRGIGWKPADSPDGADLVLLNTCSVRERAEEKVYSSLGRMAVLKRGRPELLIGVAGCVAQQEGTALLERQPALDFVLGTGNIDRLGELVERLASERSRTTLLEFDYENPAFRFEGIARDSSFKAMVTIIEGCDKYCTFCVVPFTRGRERSRAADEIVDEVRRLVEADGVIEILLLGQTVNAYVDPRTGTSFGSLLRRLSGIGGLRRIRFMTSHPKDVSDDMIEAMVSSPSICRFLHIPPQSGSDRILQRMKRQYDRAEYLSIISRLRTAIPDLAISGDLIVGFPGEDRDDFDQTLSLVKEVRFSFLYTFKYSARPGTAATRWPDHIEEETKQERLAALTSLQDGIQRELNEELVGRTLEVLVEGESKKGGQLAGRTDCNRVVNFEPNGFVPSPGDLVPVRIDRAFEYSLVGTAFGAAPGRGQRAPGTGSSIGVRG